MNFNFQQNLNTLELEDKEKEFWKEFYNSPTKREEMLLNLKQFFTDKKNIDIKKYYFSYWRWYTVLIWKNLEALDKMSFVDIVGNQIMMAILLGYDVWDKIIWYFGLKSYDESDMASLYLKIKNIFFSSSQIVGSWQGKELTIANLIEDIKILNAHDYDSIKEADLKMKLKQVMFPKNNALVKKYFTVDQDEAINRFVSLVNFFLGVDGDHIWYIVDVYINPEKYGQKQGDGVVGVKQTSLIASSMGQSQSPRINSLAQIQSLINSQFPPDASGQYADISAVFARLGELAEENDDDAITEMLYWDEGENRFRWKE